MTSGVDKLIFIGSTAVGKKVQNGIWVWQKEKWQKYFADVAILCPQVYAAGAETLTPLVLELGGKDPFLVCEDADLEQVRGGWWVICRC